MLRSRPVSGHSQAPSTAVRTRRRSGCSTNIIKSGDSVERFVEKVKNKSDGARLMDFGHRVYKNFDPGAPLSRKHVRGHHGPRAVERAFRHGKAA